jgi:DNA-binding FadR family transcriptional regulator
MDHVLDSGLGPGDRLPSEEEMARQFNVSRVSIREATNGLKFLGLLNSAPRRGTTIASVDFSRLTKYMGFQLAFGTMSESELLEARTLVEVGQLEIAARKLQPHHLTELKEIANRCCREGDSPEEIELSIQADYEFHRKLLEVGGNSALQAFSKLLENFFRHLEQHPGTIEDSRRTAQEHLLMVEALHDNNLELARGLMRNHLYRHCQPGAESTNP